jgi:hypothetical protein
MKYLAALLLAFVPCIAFADIKLNAPEEAEVGELIRLDASESACEDLIWEVIPNTEDGRNGQQARATHASRVCRTP